MGRTHLSPILFVEGWPLYRNLHVITYFSLAWKPCQSRGQRLLDVPIRIPGHLYTQASHVKVGEFRVLT